MPSHTGQFQKSLDRAALLEGLGIVSRVVPTSEIDILTHDCTYAAYMPLNLVR